MRSKIPELILNPLDVSALAVVQCTLIMFSVNGDRGTLQSLQKYQYFLLSYFSNCYQARAKRVRLKGARAKLGLLTN